MAASGSQFDAVIIGGGFYGVCIAVYLARNSGLKRVLLAEKEHGLCRRASYRNQARVHNGYHYPRSFTTANRSRVNLPRFLREWPKAVRRDFTSLYAIARRNSKVTIHQFERFCRDVGAGLRPADPSMRALFEPRLIEEVFVAEEYAFDASLLEKWGIEALSAAGVEIRYRTQATRLGRLSEHRVRVELLESDGTLCAVETDFVLNCTYSGLNQLGGDFPGIRTGLKHEITEMSLVRLPTRLREFAITVMDGPFFSIVPFPSRGLHTLSHVRYTPHEHWLDEPGVNPYQKLAERKSQSRVDRMIRDASRYLPALATAEPVDSLFEIKTVLVKNEGDDGRPILFEKHPELPGCYSILGGKIDNIFDVLEKLDAEHFQQDMALRNGVQA